MLVVNARFLTQPVTGVQRYAIELSIRLKQLDNTIIFVCPQNVIHYDIFEKLDAKITGTKTGHLWEQIDLLCYLKKQNNPLLINLCNTAPIVYKNKIITIHDIAFNVYPQTYIKTFLYLYKALIPVIIKTSKHIITVSNFSKQELIRFYHIKKEKISTVYNAASELFKYEPDLNLQNKNYFLAVSSLNYRKNLLALLKAFDSISEDKKISLYLIGDLRAKSFIQVDLRKYFSNPHIKILGRVSDSELIKYYSNAIGFLYPSLYEGFGIPPLEAQFCGCPVLVSDTSSLPEIFEDSALYCNPFSNDSIKESILKLLDEKTKISLKIKGNKNTKRFSWEQSSVMIFNVIKKFIETT
jgi:glycosyltransferase involved in cell wall biosynthesis